MLGCRMLLSLQTMAVAFTPSLEPRGGIYMAQHPDPLLAHHSSLTSWAVKVPRIGSPLPGWLKTDVIALAASLARQLVLQVAACSSSLSRLSLLESPSFPNNCACMTVRTASAQSPFWEEKLLCLDVAMDPRAFVYWEWP